MTLKPTAQRQKPKDIAALNPRLTQSLAKDDLVSFVPMSAVCAKTGSAKPAEERRYIDVSKGYTPFVNNEVLLAKITPCFENGKIAQADLSHPVGFGSTEFHVVRARPNAANPRYILHFLRQTHVHLAILRTSALLPRFLSAYIASGEGQRQVLGRNRGGVKAGLNFDDIRALLVPLPPLPLQQDFARRIAAVEKLKAAHRASLSELDALFASLQHRAFRGEL